MRLKQVLLLKVGVDLEVMAMKNTPHSPDLKSRSLIPKCSLTQYSENPLFWRRISYPFA